jgi:tetratricopeptide (TPR) repeat protein
MRRMTDRGKSPAARFPLSGQVVFVFGRLHGVTRRRLEQLIGARGGRLASKPNTRVTLIAIGHSATGSVLPDGRILLPAGLPAAAELAGESVLRRRLGLKPPPEEIDRSMSAADLERLTGLSPRLLSCLVLFDVLEPVDGRYSYRDLVAAREAGKLLARGIELRRLIEASISLVRRGLSLSEARLTEGAAGELVRDLSGEMAEFSGQLTMRLDEKARTLDELVEAADRAQETGNFAEAENLYATAMRADSRDPVVPFNLGNIFQAQSRSAEAKIAWQIAVARDPAFAEAWYNLAMAAEDEAHADLAIAQYRRAVQARSDYTDAHFNLALLLTKLERYNEALAAWERFLELEPKSEQAGVARRALALCRMALVRNRAGAG